MARLNVASTRFLGLVALIATIGCGSEAARDAELPSAKVPPVAKSKPIPHTPLDNDEDPAAEAPKQLRRIPLRAPAVSTGDPELDPLVSFLKASFSEPIKDGKRLVIMLSPGDWLPRPKQTYQDLIDKLMDQAAKKDVPADLIRDFGEKNRGNHKIWPALARHLPADLMTLDERKSIFSGPDGWKRFYEKYPSAYGSINVSRVGLNRDKTLAFFYLDEGHGALNAYGQFYILKKEADEWVELLIDIGWSWMA